jgi:ElaB/YqjD/DUF883 family membrane-anchored ribosome-binding protein
VIVKPIVILIEKCSRSYPALEAGSETVKNKAEQAENMIKERPLLSVGCAFVAGWAISKLIK